MTEPVAIIGLGCRFPGGANNPQKFWELISNGYDGVSEIPPSRWNIDQFYNEDRSVAGKMGTRCGGFIDDFDKFDAGFFGISPREAAALDPQQRMLLQVVWEMFEDAGVVPQKIKGSKTGVYVGCFATDYAYLTYSEMQRETMGLHTSLGASSTLLSNRISHFFDFHGPSLSMDTACSSSMVGVHLACKGLQNGDADMAIAGGVNMIFKPEWTIGAFKGGFLSPDGRCKVFDASANGYVRSEGVGAVLLKPLNKALADGNHIYAVIRDTGSNQDGRTKSISIPSSEAQTQLMREVYNRAGIDPKDVQYVEAHGTGTATGDPIETSAIGAVFSQGREADERCLIGSVKSNIGHMEAASGVGGLIKAALCLHHEQIPPNIHLKEVNENILLDDWQLEIVTKMRDFKQADHDVRYVGVNSFGFGGSNVHVSLQGAESFYQDQGGAKENEHPVLVPLSARNPQALIQSVQHISTYLDEDDASLYELGFNLSHHRQHHDYRAGFMASSKDELREKLAAYLDQREVDEGEGLDAVPSKGLRNVFVFSGMGPQWWGMGQQLIEKEPVFRQKIQEIDQELSKHAEWSLFDEMTKDEANSRIEETQIAQPAIFALQVALAALLESKGVTPDAIVGHSAGEVAATHLSGALSLEDACLVIYHRSRLQHQTEGQGRILATGLNLDQANEYIQGLEDKVSIGAINSANGVAIAGVESILEDIAAQLKEQKIFCKMVHGKVPYHSPLMDPLKDELIDCLKGLNPQETTVDLYSTVSGDLIDGRDITADYWFRNVRNPVLFMDAMQCLIEDDHAVFTELSPHPVLSSSIKECLEHVREQGLVISSLRRKDNEVDLVNDMVSRTFEAGVYQGWDCLYPAKARHLSLPLYPWQLERYWSESEASENYRKGTGGLKNMYGEATHPLLGAKLATAKPLWDMDIELDKQAFLKDHKVQGGIVYPGAAYIETALAAVQVSRGKQDSETIELGNIQFERALYLEEGQKTSLQLGLNDEEGHYEILARSNEAPWMRHSLGCVLASTSSEPTSSFDLKRFESDFDESVDIQSLYQSFAERGLTYDKAFQGITSLKGNGAKAVSRLSLPDGLETEGYLLHPSLLDAAFQTVLAILGRDAGIYLPVFLEKISWFKPCVQDVVCCAKLVHLDENKLVGDIVLCDEDGETLVQIQGFTCQAIATNTADGLSPFDQDLYQFNFSEEPLTLSKDQQLSLRKWCVASTDEENQRAQNLVQYLKDQGCETLSVDEASGHDQWGLVFVQSSLSLQDSQSIEDSLKQNELALLELFKQLHAQSNMPQRFCLLTSDFTNPLTASLWGMGRVAVSEHHNIKCLLANMDEDNDLSVLISALEDDELGCEIHIANGQCFANKLDRVQGADLVQKTQQDTAPVDEFSIKLSGKVQVTDQICQEVGEDQEKLRISVLNKQMPLVALGEKTSGEQALCVGNDLACSHVIVNSDMCFDIDEQIDVETLIAHVPNALTAYLAAEYNATLRNGEHVLIEQDETGLAALLLQFAVRKGAKVAVLVDDFERKQNWINLGASLVLAKNALENTALLSNWSEDKGVDVVLQTSQFSGLGSLKPFGRLICLNTSMSLNALERSEIERKSIAYSILNLAELIEHRADLVSKAMTELLEIWTSEKIVFDTNLETITLSSLLENSGATADLVKIDEITPEHVSRKISFKANAGKSYLITGGVRGFGLSVAKWLTDKGARHLVLLGRSDKIADESKEIIKGLEADGVKVKIKACDVSNATAVDQVIDEIEASGFPLGGIIHAANIYDDAYLNQMSAESFERVYKTKVMGAWNLHHSSAGLDLEFFVLFSSISALIGNAGQANYVAGNNFLSALAQQRRQSGLAGLSINWGAIADVGYLANNEAVEKQLAETGIEAISPVKGLEAMGELIMRDVAQIGVCKVDWDQFITNSPSSQKIVFEKLLSQQEGENGGVRELTPTVQEILETPAMMRKEKISAQLLKQVMQILGLGQSQKPTQKQGFADLGMDSMLSVEFKNRLQTNYGCSLPATLVFLYPNVDELGDYLLNEALSDVLGEPIVLTQEEEAPVIDETIIEEASLDEVAAMLEETLAM